MVHRPEGAVHGLAIVARCAPIAQWILRLVRAIRGVYGVIGSGQARRAIPLAHARRLPRQQVRFAIAFTTLSVGRWRRFAPWLPPHR